MPASFAQSAFNKAVLPVVSRPSLLRAKHIAKAIPGDRELYRGNDDVYDISAFCKRLKGIPKDERAGRITDDFLLKVAKNSPLDVVNIIEALPLDSRGAKITPGIISTVTKKQPYALVTIFQRLPEESRAEKMTSTLLSKMIEHDPGVTSSLIHICPLYARADKITPELVAQTKGDPLFLAGILSTLDRHEAKEVIIKNLLQNVCEDDPFTVPNVLKALPIDERIQAVEGGLLFFATTKNPKSLVPILEALPEEERAAKMTPVLWSLVAKKDPDSLKPLISVLPENSVQLETDVITAMSQVNPDAFRGDLEQSWWRDALQARESAIREKGVIYQRTLDSFRDRLEYEWKNSGGHKR